MSIAVVAAGTSECCAAVEQLGSQVERLKQQLTPRSSFIPTGNRTMASMEQLCLLSLSGCQLQFSWTELHKVLSLFDIITLRHPFLSFRQVVSVKVLICLQS